MVQLIRGQQGNKARQSGPSACALSPCIQYFCLALEMQMQSGRTSWRKGSGVSGPWGLVDLDMYKRSQISLKPDKQQNLHPVQVRSLQAQGRPE